MQTNELLEGLMLLQVYYNDPEGYNTDAEHDILYAYATDTPLPEAVVNRLCELGWFQPEVEVDDEEEFAAKNYDAAEGWAAFV